ncbi:hypothetical protein D3C76_1066920 [compost metagenome]
MTLFSLQTKFQCRQHQSDQPWNEIIEQSKNNKHCHGLITFKSKLRKTQQCNKVKSTDTTRRHTQDACDSSNRKDAEYNWKMHLVQEMTTDCPKRYASKTPFQKGGTYRGNYCKPGCSTLSPVNPLCIKSRALYKHKKRQIKRHPPYRKY